MKKDLGFIGELDDQSPNRKWRLICKAVVNTLVPHVPREDASVSGEAGDGDADVVVDFEDLLLVRRQLGVSLVNASQDHVSLRSEPDRRRALFHSFHCVLHLEQPPRRAPCRDIRIILVPEHFRLRHR